MILLESLTIPLSVKKNYYYQYLELFPVCDLLIFTPKK